jgi:hypothetical protein
VDVAHKWGADAVDGELERLIAKRASQDRRPDPDELEPSYMKGVNRYNARRREENRQAWASFHEEQAERHRRTLEDLISHRETQAARLCERS